MACSRSTPFPEGNLTARVLRATVSSGGNLAGFILMPVTMKSIPTNDGARQSYAIA